MTEAEARQDELLGEVVLPVARYCGVKIDPAGDGFLIDRMCLAVCDMLDGTNPMPAPVRSAADEWWLIEFRMVETG